VARQKAPTKSRLPTSTVRRFWRSPGRSRTRTSSGRMQSCILRPGARSCRRAGKHQIAGHLDLVGRHERAAEEIHRADEIGDEGGRRPAVDLLRRAHLLDAPWFITTMRSAMVSASSWSCVTMMVVTPRRRCSLDLVPQANGARGHRAPRAARRAAAGRRRGERAGQRHALLLAAGKLGRIFRSRIWQPDQGQQLGHALLDLAAFWRRLTSP
jgi:hypothetical protein